MDQSSSDVPAPSLGSYLRHSRARYAGKLSRTALAAAAQIGHGYLSRLEQGTATNPSPAVVDRLARALALDDIGRRHLHDLVAYHRVEPGSVDDLAPGMEVTKVMRQVVDHLTPHLAGYVDDAWNVAYANDEYARIYRHITDPRINNVLKWFFMVPESRAIMIEWEEEARLTVAWLRWLMVRRPGSRLFGDLLGELSRSGHFVRMWALQDTRMGRRSPYMLVRDLDRGRELRLLAQVCSWPNPARPIQLYLGVRTDDKPA